jgi:hypothetical protein
MAKITIYYVTWCKYSTNLLTSVWCPVKESKKYSNLEFVEVNCTDAPVPNIEAYPTVILEIGDKKIDYIGTIGYQEKRTIESLEKFISENLGTLTQTDNLKESNNQFMDYL